VPNVRTDAGLIRQLRDSADRWQLPFGWVVWLNLVAIVAVPILVVLFFAWRPAFRLILDEDGIVEYGQVLLWAASAVVGGVIALDRVRRGHPMQALLWAAFVLAGIFIVGEEISWGQRLFGFETPDVLEEINRQDEANLHNIGRTLTVFNIGIFVASLYAIAAEWIHRRWNLVRGIVDGDRLYVPPFALAGLFAVMVAYRVVRWVVLTQESYALTSLSEWAELCFVAGLFITVLLSALWLSHNPMTGPQESAG
jgi:hypothetical protein